MSDINQADSVTRQKISSGNSGIVSAAAAAIGLKKPVDIDSEVAKARSADDTSFLDDITMRRQKVGAIQRAAAQMMSDVEDLTTSNIDTWKMPEFPKS